MLVLVKVLVGWFILMLAGTNLIGMVVRGFFRNKDLEDIKSNPDTHDFIKGEINKFNKIDDNVTIVSLIIILGYFFALYHFWNLGVLISGLMLVISRIPDLLLEIKTGDKHAWKNAPKDFKYVLTSMLTWGSLLVLWYSLTAFYNQ